MWGNEMKRLYVTAIAVMAALTGAARADAASKITPAEYCVATGGAVQTRIPEYGTNGGTPLVLAGPLQFCQYTSAKDGSQISLLLSTLTAEQPSLAALAYYAKVKVNLHKCRGGPGSCYCSDLGGTDEFGGINLNGGGWVNSTNATDVLDLCVFPDESAIDAYGLFYHSHSIIRGTNLSRVLIYKNPN